MAEVAVALASGMGASAGVASTIGTVASIGQVVAPVLGAVAQNRNAKAQEAEFRRQSTEERIAASIKAERMRRDARLAQSRERSAMAEAGVLSGTSFGVLDQNAVARELDALTVEYQGEQAADSASARARQARRHASPLNVFSAAIEGFNQVDPMNLAPNGGA